MFQWVSLGALGPPLMLFPLWTRPLRFQWSSDWLIKVALVWLPYALLISLLAKWHPQVPLAPFEETQLAPQLGFVGVGSFPLFPYYPRPCPGPLA